MEGALSADLCQAYIQDGDEDSENRDSFISYCAKL